MVQDWGQLDEASREKLVDSLVGVGQYQKMKVQAEQVVVVDREGHAAGSHRPDPGGDVEALLRSGASLGR